MPRRLLGTPVVLVALTLLQWPTFARSEIIVEDDSSLTGLNNSTATYNATTRELRIKGNDAFSVSLAAYEPVLSLDLKLVAESNEIRDVFNALAVDENTRAVILSGNGKSFCAGLDLKENLLIAGTARDDSVDVARTARKTREDILSLQRAFAAIRECPKPVIAAIHGNCIGGGVDLAAWCDIRWATADATFSVREVNLGLAADIGSLNLLPKICGNASWIREIAYTGRFFTADEALQHGFISKVLQSNDALLKAAENFAANLASNSPVALQGTKQVLNYSSDHTLSDSLTYVAHWNMSQLLTEDIPKAAHAMLTKQVEPPLFAKL